MGRRGGRPGAAVGSQGALRRGLSPPRWNQEQFGLTFPTPARPKQPSRGKRALLTFWVYFKPCHHSQIPQK